MKGGQVTNKYPRVEEEGCCNIKRNKRCLPEGLHLEVAVVGVLMHDRLLERLENGSLWVAIVFERRKTSDGGRVFGDGAGE